MIKDLHIKKVNPLVSLLVSASDESSEMAISIDIEEPENNSIHPPG